MSKEDNVIQQKTFAFAVSVVRFARSLRDMREYELASQFLRCGTSVGASVEEAIAAQSKKDFVHKLSIATKEAREAAYWIRLLRDSDTCPCEALQQLQNQAKEIIRILNRILATCRDRYTDEVREAGSEYIPNSEFLIPN